MPTPEWRNDGYGQGRHALFMGGLYVGHILEWRKYATDSHIHNGKWRGWFMSDDEGDETGFFATADEARASVEAALAAALNVPAKETSK